MNEAEWLACDDPGLLLRHPAGRASERKGRLFAVACCRHMLELVPNDGQLKSVEVSERYADDPAGVRAFRTDGGPVGEAARLIALDKDVSLMLMYVTWWARDWKGPSVGGRSEVARQADLYRDIYGNPFRPVSSDPQWLTSTVVDLARTMYEARDFAAMPILADALQDAGCEDADILAHCRGGGPHVRGCWVVDLVLGKS